MTNQEKMQATLAKAGIPFKEIRCYGSQIVVTAWSKDAAIKWAMLLAKFATIRNTAFESLDDAVEQRLECGVNRNHVKVWRTFAAIV